jgi:DNA polymerase III subunit delta'
MSGFSGIYGQETAIGTLQRALRAGKVHHAYRFEGPEGVGKEKTAFALAQALVCEQRTEFGDASCGACHACVRALKFSKQPPKVPLHPDVLVIERGLYPAAVLGRNREENQGISVDQIRKVILTRMAYPPHEGKARIIIVRNAHELTVSAANGLLKTLEEPPKATHFILITNRGRELIDTIRSRTLLLRFAPLNSTVLGTILSENGIQDPQQKQLAIDLAAGSAATALEQVNQGDLKDKEKFVKAVMEAMVAPSMAPAIVLAGSHDKDRSSLQNMLNSLAVALARQARERVTSSPQSAKRAAHRYEIVTQTIKQLDRNAAPALALETMIAKMRAVYLSDIYSLKLR